MATIKELLFLFLNSAPLNISRIEKEAGLSPNTLMQARKGRRDIPRKHFFNVLAVCIKYGFKIPSMPNTTLYVDIEGHTLTLITNLPKTDVFEVDENGNEYKLPENDYELYEYQSQAKGKVYFLYKQHQYRMLLDEFEIENEQF